MTYWYSYVPDRFCDTSSRVKCWVDPIAVIQIGTSQLAGSISYSSTAAPNITKLESLRSLLIRSLLHCTRLRVRIESYALSRSKASLSRPNTKQKLVVSSPHRFVTMVRATRSTMTKADPGNAGGMKVEAKPTTKQGKGSKGNTKAAKASEDPFNEPPIIPANTSKKRARSSVKQEPTEDEDEAEAESEAEVEAPQSKRAKSSSKPKAKSKTKAAPKPDLEAGAKVAASITGDSPLKKSKANPYQLSPGESPYPTYAKPTPEDCKAVHDALATIHGTISAPKSIEAPSLTSSGCGEVPSVLDALVRTRLSAATNGANSSRAFRGLVDRYGLLKEGTGKGSVDWMAVRHSDVKEVFTCIQSGGLADVKSRDIKKILDLVYEENVEQRKEVGEKGEPKVLSLDHLHGMQSDAAFQKLLEYPGIGPKTASCVLLFCMQRPSFAVDTHVFRLTRWVGWTPSDSQVRGMGKEVKKHAGVKDEDGEAPATPSKKKAPPPVTRNTTYAHLDVRIPDELKYPLHYLFIKHGKTCPECSAKPDRKTKEAWGKKV